MSTGQPANIPVALSTARRQFNRWRSLHRKNAHFYKTQNGTRVGDLFMSLIHTCEVNDVNPFDYLTQLQKHANELSSDPDSRMPWNYQDMLQKTTAT